MKIKIKNDLFNISKRIKNISRDYFVFFDDKSRRYLVCDEKGGNVYFTLPFNALDARSLFYIQKERQKTNIEILKEIELNNKNCEKAINEKIVEQSICSAEKVLRRS